MACYLCYRECRGWRACVRGALMWVVCLRWWRASVGEVLAWVMWAGCQGDVPAWMAWAVHQRG